MTTAYINRVASEVPPHQAHDTFVRFAENMLAHRDMRRLFGRMVERSQIERRWTCLTPPREGCNQSLDGDGFYTLGQFPSTGQRMERYEAEAPALAEAAVNRLGLGQSLRNATHLIVASCTGFSAPGIDLEIIRRCELDPSIERTVIGFMGCHAAINALKLAHHIVRSRPDSRVLVVCLELCTLHLQETGNLDQLLTFLLFGDGCSAALISAEATGFSIDGFHAMLVQTAADQITWNIGDVGFDMGLSGLVPSTIIGALRSGAERVLLGASASAIDLWAVHPGGRSVLDAVEYAFGLGRSALTASRTILRDYGNMSSPTVLFVLEALMKTKPCKGERGCAMAFGPGLTTETMLFSAVA